MMDFLVVLVDRRRRYSQRAGDELNPARKKDK
jgi:hypothetical protein